MGKLGGGVELGLVLADTHSHQGEQAHKEDVDIKKKQRTDTGG